MLRIIITFVCLILFPTFSFAETYEKRVVGEIDIVPETPEGVYFDSEKVKTFLRTRVGELFSQTQFDNDLKTLSSEYEKIEPSLEIKEDKLKITLVIAPKSMIRSIKWEGNQSISTKDLQKELGVKICSVFDRIAFNKAFHKLKEFYLKRGFFEAELSYRIEKDPLTQEVDLCIVIQEGRSGWISRMYFSGFTCDEESAILELMVTKKFNVFMSWLTSEGLYNEEAVEHDKAQIINFLQNEGYADAVVTIEAIDSPRFLERVHLHITACKGEQYTLGELTFEGNTLFDDEEVRKCFLVCEGDYFSPEKLRETATRIEHLYGSKGYIDASIAYEPKLELECGNVYSVHFQIEEGCEHRVGMIKVFGNCTTQTNVILHETLLIPGEVFNSRKLELTEKRLKNIGYFENVNVYAVRTDEESSLGGNYRDVHIEVEEKQTGRFSTFFGYSTMETLFGGFSITEKNFNSAGLSGLFCKNGPGLRGGGEYLNTTIQFGRKSRSYLLSWTKPYFMDSKWSVGFDLENSSNSYISDDYDIKAVGYTLRGSYDINAFMRAGVHYRIRHTNVNLDHDAFQCRELYKASRIHGLISAVGVTLGYDSTDRFDMPTRGFRSMLELEFAGVGGDHSFLSFAYLNSYYIPLCQKGVLKFRADLRLVDPIWNTDFNHLPLDERLFLGGDNTVRGYKPYKIGPRFKCKNKHAEGNGDPKGGIMMEILSMEYNHHLFSRMIGFAFIDAGVLNDKLTIYHTLYTSVGVGARIKVLDSYPPLTLGVGFPINPQRRNQVKNFFFSFGGTF